jgi:hypothetical protein
MLSLRLISPTCHLAFLALGFINIFFANNPSGLSHTAAHAQYRVHPYQV